jgi:zinc protease
VAPLAPPVVPERPTPAPARVRRPERERVEAGVHVYRLATGMPVLIRQRVGAPMTYAGVFALGGGSAESAPIGGRTLMMARTALKGTRQRSAVQIAEDGELLGGSVSSSVGSDVFGWSISVPRAHLAAALDLLADVTQHPTFAAQALDTERAVALAELHAITDDMYRYPMRLAMQAAFPRHPYGVPALGTEESLGAQRPEDLARWHAEHVLAGTTVVAVVGDGEPEELAQLVARHFDQLRFREAAPVPVPQWPDQLVTLAESRDKAQTALVLVWPGPTRADPERFDLGVLAGIASGLGGRLFEELRDKQSLCYTVSAFPAERRVAGTFSAYIATSPVQEEVAREGLLRELARFRDEPVLPGELRRAQMYAVGTHAIRQQSGAAVMGEMVDAWMFGTLQELEQHDPRIMAVTADSILAVARRYLVPGRRVEGVVRGAGRTV